MKLFLYFFILYACVYVSYAQAQWNRGPCNDIGVQIRAEKLKARPDITDDSRKLVDDATVKFDESAKNCSTVPPFRGQQARCCAAAKKQFHIKLNAIEASEAAVTTVSPECILN